DAASNSFLDVVDHTPEITACYVCTYHNMALHVFTINSVGAGNGSDISNKFERYFPAIRVDRKFTDRGQGFLVILRDPDCEVQSTSAFVNLRNHAPGKHDFYEFSKFRQGNAITSEKVSLRRDR